MSTIATFYSYKGGVGRTMAMANVAVLLAQRGLRVLAVDWDLEAPGLRAVLRVFTVEPGKGGLLPLLREQRRGSRGHYRPHLTRVHGTGGSSFSLDLLPSGREGDPNYATTLERFDWERYFKDGGGDFIESLRTRWLKEYDVTLIDSRTGLSDTGGICRIQLPDVVVAMFTANHQSLLGVRDIMRLALEARDRLAYDRLRLRVSQFREVCARYDDRRSQRMDQAHCRNAGRVLSRLDSGLGRVATGDEAAEGAAGRRLRFWEKLAVVETDSLTAKRLTVPFGHVADLITQEEPNAAATLGIDRKNGKRPKPTAPASKPGYEYDVYVSHAAGSVLDDWLDRFIGALRSAFELEVGREPPIYLDSFRDSVRGGVGGEESGKPDPLADNASNRDA